MKRVMHVLKTYPYLYRLVLNFRFFLKGRFFSDKTVYRRKFKKRIGRNLDLNTPRSLNEKLVWLNLNWESNLARQCCDKLLVRDYVAEKAGPEILNQLHGSYNSTSEIDIDALPDRFILKTTHGSGWNIVCSDKSTFNWKTAKTNLDTWMRLDYYHQNRERHYRGLPTRIICERHLPMDPDDVIDYKIFCMNGEPYNTFVCSDRRRSLKVDCYDLDWNKLDIQRNCPNSDVLLPKPVHYEQMLEICRKLAAPFPFVRVDLYEAWDQVIFGELTFIPDNGVKPFIPDSYDYVMGEALQLPEPKNIQGGIHV